MGFILFNGTPGDVWENATGRVAYQLIVAWNNTCGVCAQYDHAISNSWPTPFHYGCRCHQRAIYPGKESEPFVSFRKEIDALPHEERVHIVGASNYELLKKGVIEWGDVVTPGRIRTLREVVSIKGLTVKQLTDAGVAPRYAKEAFTSVNTLAHSFADEARRRMIEAMKEKGVAVADTRKLIAEHLAARVTIGGGPSGLQGSLVKLSPLPPSFSPDVKPFVLPHPAKPASQLTEEQLRTLFGIAIKKEAMAPPPATVKPAPFLPDHPIGQRIAEWEEGDHIRGRMIRATEAAQAKATKAEAEKDRLYEAMRKVEDEQQEILNKLGRRTSVAKARQHPDYLAAGERHEAAWHQYVLASEEAKAAQKGIAPAAHGALPVAVEPPRWDVLDRPSHGWKFSDGRGIAMDFPSPEVLDKAKEARAWLARFLNKGDRDVFEVGVSEIPASYDGRAHCGFGNGLHTALAKTDEVHTHVHEFGHAIDEQVSGGKMIGQRCREFLDHRVGSELSVKLKDVVPGSSYKDDERGRKDKFADAFGGNEHRAYYAGKEYPGNVSEILALGVEQLYENPLQFAKGDPEYFKFVVGILRGDLR